MARMLFMYLLLLSTSSDCSQSSDEDNIPKRVKVMVVSKSPIKCVWL